MYIGGGVDGLDYGVSDLVNVLGRLGEGLGEGIVGIVEGVIRFWGGGIGCFLWFSLKRIGGDFL